MFKKLRPFLYAENRTDDKEEGTPNQEGQPKARAHHHRVEKKTIAKGFAIQPLVVMESVGLAYRHGNMTVQDCDHKGDGKK